MLSEVRLSRWRSDCQAVAAGSVNSDPHLREIAATVQTLIGEIDAQAEALIAEKLQSVRLFAHNGELAQQLTECQQQVARSQAEAAAAVRIACLLYAPNSYRDWVSARATMRESSQPRKLRAAYLDRLAKLEALGDEVRKLSCERRADPGRCEAAICGLPISLCRALAALEERSEVMALPSERMDFERIADLEVELAAQAGALATCKATLFEAQQAVLTEGLARIEAERQLTQVQAEAAVMRVVLTQYTQRINTANGGWCEVCKEVPPAHRPYCPIGTALSGTAGQALLDRLAKLEADDGQMSDEIEAWKLATGLVGASGDPDGITPRHLEGRLAKLEAVGHTARDCDGALADWINARAAEAMNDHSPESMTRTFFAYKQLLDTAIPMRDALAALDEKEGRP